MDPAPHASPATDVERRAYSAERPGFRIQELQISPTQEVPWHFHHEVQDMLFVVEGELRVFLRDPDEEVLLHPRETLTIRPGRPHRVTNAGHSSATFMNLQAGNYDYVRLN
jgi:mannose-6-phosphate isomerase-like protein (cupin superfamily)